MHSQQMFNECIAETGYKTSLLCLEFSSSRTENKKSTVSLRTRERRTRDREQVDRRPHGERNLVHIVLWFNVLPSSELGGGRQRHPTASSSEALRRT